MGYTEVLIASLYFISFAIPWSPQKGSSIGWLTMKCSVDPIKIPSKHLLWSLKHGLLQYLLLALFLFFTQEKFSCSLVLKLKKWDVLYFQVRTGTYNTVYCAAGALVCSMYQVLFQCDTSSETNCNRNFQGQSSKSVDCCDV